MTFLENIDKANLKKILLVVISVLTLAALALLLVIIVMSIAPKAPAKSDIELKDYTVTEKDLSTGTLILADSEHPFTAGTELISTMINCQQFRNEHRGGVDKGPYYAMNNVQLSQVAMEAAHELLIAAENAIQEENILIKYAYYGDDGKTAEFATGMLMFLTDYDEEKLPDSYAAWLQSHAREFGFVESYTDAYRYVGNVHASYMTTKKLSVADYVDYLKKYTNVDRALTVKVDGAEYLVYFVPCKSGDSIKVPADLDYTVSGTNDGGVVITAKKTK